MPEPSILARIVVTDDTRFRSELRELHRYSESAREPVLAILPNNARIAVDGTYPLSHAIREARIALALNN